MTMPMNRLVNILIISMLGAFGGALSGFFSIVGAQLLKGPLGQSVAAFLLVVAFVLVPLGVLLGLSIHYSIRQESRRSIVIIGGAIGGMLYGLLTTLSLLGGILGLSCLWLGLVLSLRKTFPVSKIATRLGVGFAAMVFLFLLIMRLSSEGYWFSMTMFDPLRVIDARGPMAAINLIGAAYILNLFLLVSLWSYLRTVRQEK